MWNAERTEKLYSAACNGAGATCAAAQDHPWRAIGPPVDLQAPARWLLDERLLLDLQSVKARLQLGEAPTTLGDRHAVSRT